MRLKRSGFSLVLSLTVMAAMVLMVIVLASFLQVESRLAQGNAGYQRAKLNALASARMAVAQLQQLAGPDQRVTMRADMYSNEVTAAPGPASTPTSSHTNPNKPTAVAHQKRYWTGIWATGGVDSSRARDWSVADPHETRLFLGWLTSPTATDATNAELVDKDSLNFYMPNRLHFSPTDGKVAGGTSSEGQQLINKLNTALSMTPFTGSNFVRLVGGSQATAGQPVSGSVQWPATATTAVLQEFYGAVDLPTMPLPGPTNTTGGSLGSKGRFAYWIGDEGIKAKVNLPDFQATNGSGATMPGLTDWDKGFAGSASQRSAFESVTPSLNPATAALMPAGFSANYLSLRSLDIGEATTKGSWKSLGLAKARNRNEINLWAGKVGGTAAGDALTSANRLLWHETTPYSYSVLSDTLNGGMKNDLSTAFELPYAVFRSLELYPGQKEAATTPTTEERKQSLFHGAPNGAYSKYGMATDLDYNRPNLVDKIGSPQDLLKAVPRSPEWAMRYFSSIPSIDTTLKLLRGRNGGETPERLGFAYEVPLSSQFFDSNRIAANRVSLTAASNERTADKNDVLPWSDIKLQSSAKPDADNWTGRIIRGPTWDLYRNYYRMYKREVEAAASADPSALRGQGGPADEIGFIVRGVEPLTYATGNRGLPTQRSTPVSTDNFKAGPNPTLDKFFSGGGAAKNYFHRNNLADGGVGPSFQAERRFRIPFEASLVGGSLTPEGKPILPKHRVAAGLSHPTDIPDSDFDENGGIPTQVTTTKTWPTSPVLAPTILRFSTIYQAVRDGSKNKLGMTVDPIVVIHNPYDVALEFEGLAMVTSGMSSPFRFIFQVPNITYKSTELQWADPMATPPRLAGIPNAFVSRTDTIDIGDVVIGGGENDNRSTSFRIVAGETTSGAAKSRVIRLEPGEIKVVGTAPSTGDLVNSNNSNVSVAGDLGFELSSRAFYAMTPFHNVRSRLGSGARNENAERILWTMDFDACEDFSSYDPDGSGPLPPISKTNGRFSDAEYSRRVKDLWGNVVNQRRIRDAMVRRDVFNNPIEPWDGSATSLESVLNGQAMRVIVRNTGWINYNGYIVGAEGEVVTVTPGADGIPGNADDPLPTYTLKQDRYVAPTRRTGRIALQGNQSWNFYLIGKKSIDGGTALNTHRRWFGSPDIGMLKDDPDSYDTDPINPGRKIRKYSEGTQTVNGFSTVDESLLLNFQAMTSGWPLYSNSNGDEAYYIQPDREWTRLAPFLQSPPTPNFAIKGSSTDEATTKIPYDPEFNTQNGKQIEVTASKADTLFSSSYTTVTPGFSDPVFMVDFVRRSADMTKMSDDRWYPSSLVSSGFGMSAAPTINYGANFNLRTPDEMRNAPMSPFFLSDRAQQAQLFGYDGKAHTPIGWIETQRVLKGSLADARLAFSGTGLAKENAFWGKSTDDGSGGLSNIILYSVPRRPLLSLSQLGTVAFAEKNTDPDLTVGSSFAHPGIGDLTRIVEWPGPRDFFSSEGTLASDVKGPVPELGYVAKAMGSRPVRNRADVRTDHAFAANYALWDTYYFSGLNLQGNSFSHLDGASRDWPNAGADLPIDSKVQKAQALALDTAGLGEPRTFSAYKLALNEGKSLLANKRMAYLPDGKASYTASNDYKNSLRLPETEFPHPKYLSRNSLYDGGFNVNSTSKAAWKAILGGLRGQTLPDATGTASGTALTRFARAFGTASDKTGNDPWTSYRELNDNEIDDLAGKVVEEVRARGPFMSLADFVNRRLVNNDAFGLKGALQAAIDKSAINNVAVTQAGGTFSAPASVDLTTDSADPNSHLFSNMNTNGGWWKAKSAYPKIPANKRFPSLRAMSRNNNEGAVVAGLGAPGIVTQMDVLNSVGPNLTARSDTFVVRAYGEAHDDAGNVIGKAWVEVVVQRTTEYVAMAVGQKFPEHTELNRRKLAYRVNSSANKEYDKQVLVETYERAPLPNPPGATVAEKTGLAQEQRINRILGRRFRATGLRWLSANEI